MCKIFVVDDEAAIAEMLGIILRSNGFVTKSFVTGESALAAAASAKPDILISDYLMPGMDGLTLAHHIREYNPSCTVIMISGAWSLAAQHPYLDQFERFDKPLEIRELLERVNIIRTQIENRDLTQGTNSGHDALI